MGLCWESFNDLPHELISSGIIIVCIIRHKSHDCRKYTLLFVVYMPSNELKIRLLGTILLMMLYDDLSLCHVIAVYMILEVKADNSTASPYSNHAHELTFTKASTWWFIMGLLAKGTNGLGIVKVSGRKRVPKPTKQSNEEWAICREEGTYTDYLLTCAFKYWKYPTDQRTWVPFFSIDNWALRRDSIDLGIARSLARDAKVYLNKVRSPNKSRNAQVFIS